MKKDMDISQAQPSATDVWRHDLRNATNSAMMATLLAQRFIEAGDSGAALTNLRRAGEAFAILTRLLDSEPLDESRRRG